MYYQIRYIGMGNIDHKQVRKTAQEYYDFWGGDESQIIFELNKILESTPILSEIERFWLDVRKEVRTMLGYKKPKVVKEHSIYDEENWIVLPDGRITNKYFQNPYQLTKHGLWEGNRHKDEGIADWHKEAIELEKFYWDMMKDLALMVDSKGGNYNH